MSTTQDDPSPVAPLQYGALIIIDPEEEYYQEEISKLEFDIKHLGLGERT